MRISDWSSDVCSSDLLLEDRVADRIELSFFSTQFLLECLANASEVVGNIQAEGPERHFVLFLHMHRAAVPVKDADGRQHRVRLAVVGPTDGRCGYTVDRKSTRLNSSH